MRSKLRLATLALLVVPGCGRSLPSETEGVDLSPKGLAARLDAPKGATVRELVVQGSVELAWGDLDGTMTLRPWTVTSPGLECPASDASCKVVASDGASVLYKATYQTRPKHFGFVNLTLGSTKVQCAVVARELDNARRLLAACKTASGTGAVVASAVASPATTLTSATLVTLEDVTFKEKVPSGEMKVSLRAPRGWESQPVLRGGRIFLDPAAKASAAEAITIRVTPYPTVTTLAQAEAEVRRADTGGLDAIAERRALGPRTFQISTAPRGTGQIMAVNVFASGKKQAMWANCYGPAKRKATLEDVCSSLKVE